MATYGADTARWFMLSDSPPERDVIWTAAGVEGAGRFVQRIWRLVNEVAALGAPAGAAADPKAQVRVAAHRGLAAVGDAIEGLRFNVAVARIYELANALQAEMGNATDPAALREAADILVRLM